MTALIKAVFRNKKDKEISAAESIFILNKTVAENTVAMVRLTTQMEYVSDAIRLIPEIRRDVDGLGSKSRKLESDLVRLKEEIQGG